MSSARDQQEQHPPHCGCSSSRASVSDEIHVETPASEQKEDEGHDLASQTANLDLEDQETDPDISNNNATDTWSDEDAPCETTDEQAKTELERASAATPINAVEVDQSETVEGIKDAEDGTVSKSANTESEQDDETSTPRFETYVKLHNDMMTAKSTLASSETELVDVYHHASHVARILLTSHEKHGDLPLVMHAHACLVLGCSDEDDCYERLEEALVLLRHAMEEGVVGQQEGEKMIKICEVVMGMRGKAPSDDEESVGSEEDSEDDSEGDGKGESDKHKESKVENADGDEGYEKNDVLP